MANVTKEQLEELYINRGLNVRQCAKELGLATHGSVIGMMKRFGIKARPQLQVDKFNGGAKPRKINKETVYCTQCGVKFKLFPSLITDNNFCSSDCYRKWRRTDDLSGKTFGRLTVINEVEPDSHGHIQYLCKCDCGNKATVLKSSLVRGFTTSCGCYDFYASAFEAVGFAEKLRRDPKNKMNVQGVCTSCGCWMDLSPSQVGRRKHALLNLGYGESRFYCSDECKSQCSIYRQHKYPKGFKPDNYRNEILDPDLNNLVLNRDSYQCQKCGATEDLNVHHIEGVAQEPMLANDIYNCITVCHSCHVEIHSQPGCTFADYQREACEPDSKEAINQLTN